MVVPAGGSGDVFAGEPYIARQYARHQPAIEVILFNVTIRAEMAHNASDDLGDTAVDDEVILWAGVNPSAA